MEKAFCSPPIKFFRCPAYGSVSLFVVSLFFSQIDWQIGQRRTHPPFFKVGMKLVLITAQHCKCAIIRNYINSSLQGMLDLKLVSMIAWCSPPSQFPNLRMEGNPYSQCLLLMEKGPFEAAKWNIFEDELTPSNISNPGWQGNKYLMINSPKIVSGRFQSQMRWCYMLQWRIQVWPSSRKLAKYFTPKQTSHSI